MRARAVVGWNIRRFRVKQGKTIEELANDSEVDSSNLARIERSAVNSSIDVLERIAVALKVPLIELFVVPPEGAIPPAPLKAGRRPSK